MIRIKAGPSQSAKALEDAITEACRVHLNAVLAAATVGVKRSLGYVVRSLIEGTPEYQSLLTGDLRGEFGLDDPQPRLLEVLSVIERSMVVRHVPLKKYGRGLVGGMTVGILKSDYQDILSLTEASYVSQPSGELIEWADWLLTRGDEVVVFGYEIFKDLDPIQRARSRSGLALMRPGTGWRVPSWAAGRPGDNFLTRAFDVSAAETLIAATIQREIEARL